MPDPVCSVIIKTHNSHRFFPKVMECLERQTVAPDTIVIMDSASKDTSYLAPYMNKKNVEVIIEKEDVGFCKGNNIGYDHVKEKSDYILFLNPDAFLSSQFIEKAIACMEDAENERIAALTGILLGFDINKDQPTGLYDSTGIFQKRYGRWYDRDQGTKVDPDKYYLAEKIPAICGALFFCRNRALKEVLIRQKEVFDNNFYMYKEDIDLSLRFRKKGWELLLEPSLQAYHCRGWNQNRSLVPKTLRMYSAKNEVKIHARQRSPHLFYSMLKYMAVKLFNV